MDIALNFQTNFFGPGGSFLAQPSGISTLVSIFLNNALILAGIVFVFLVILAAYQMIGGAGHQNPAMFARGQQTLIAAIIGLIIVFASYWIIQALELFTGTNILKT